MYRLQFWYTYAFSHLKQQVYIQYSIHVKTTLDSQNSAVATQATTLTSTATATNSQPVSCRTLSKVPQEIVDKYKFWNTIKNSKYPAKCDRNICLWTGNTGVISVHYQLPLWFGQFVFKVTLICTASAFITNFYRDTSLVVTEMLSTINRFWSVNKLIGRGSLRYKILN